MWLGDPQDSTGAASFAVIQVACPVEARAASHALRTRSSVHNMAFTTGNANAAYGACIWVMGAGTGVRHLESGDGKNGGNRRRGAFRGRRWRYVRHGRWTRARCMQGTAGLDRWILCDGAF